MSDPVQVVETLFKPQTSHALLLDAIDDLHSRGVGQLVSLPHLVVCGFQFDASQPLLENLLRVRFPARVAPRTLFVTKIILRRRPVPHFKVTIEPGPNEKSESELQRLKLFKPNAGDNVSEQLFSCLEQATQFMETIAKEGYSDNILRIEVFGPDKSDLTLIDLPLLLFPDPSGDRDRKIEFAHRIRATYMHNPRSIIVVVMPAEADVGLERTCKLAKKYDKGQKRVFGVVTHLGEIAANSKKVKCWVDIMNQATPASLLGVHFLCTQSYGTCNVPGSERDETEKAFFNRAEWNVVAKQLTGIENLRLRLDAAFANQLHSSFSGLNYDVNLKIWSHNRRLAKLSTPRETVQEQKELLFHLGGAFERITEQALSGMYMSEFFIATASAPKGKLNDTRLLRASIRELNKDFADVMVSAGCYRFVDGLNHQSKSLLNSVNSYAELRTPERITRAAFEREVTEKIQQQQGIEFPGHFNQILLGSLFRHQSKPWEEIARAHLLKSWKATRDFVKLLLAYLADEAMGAAMLHEIIDPQFDAMKCTLLAKLDELTAYYKQGHPLPLQRAYLRGQSLPLDQSYLVKTAKAQGDRLLTKLEETLLSTMRNSFTNSFTMNQFQVALQSLDSSRNQFAVSDFVDQMQSYYNHALMVYVDNIFTLGIENCLLVPLARMVTTQTMGNIEDSELEKLFARTKEAQDNLTCELAKLHHALRTLKRFRIVLRPMPSTLTATQPTPISRPEFAPRIPPSLVPQGISFKEKSFNLRGMQSKDTASGALESTSRFQFPSSNCPGSVNSFDLKPSLSGGTLFGGQRSSLSSGNPQPSSSGFGMSTSAFAGPRTSNLSAPNAGWPSFGGFSPAKSTSDINKSRAFLTEKDVNGVTCHFQSISLSPSWRHYSFEELRWACYGPGLELGGCSTQQAPAGIF